MTGPAGVVRVGVRSYGVRGPHDPASERSKRRSRPHASDLTARRGHSPRLRPPDRTSASTTPSAGPQRLLHEAALLLARQLAQRAGRWPPLEPGAAAPAADPRRRAVGG